MTRPVRSPGKPLKPHWWETHRGGVSVRIENQHQFAAEVCGWHLLVGCIQRMPYAERCASIEAGRLLYEVEPVVLRVCAKGHEPLVACPGQLVCFDVLAWEPHTITLTLEYEKCVPATPTYEHWYLPLFQREP